MKRPEMIIFDYGHTLAYEPGFDLSRGHRELFRHVVKNPDNVTAERLKELGDEIFSIQRQAQSSGYEPHCHQGYRAMFGYFGLELDVDIAEAERIIWDNTSVGEEMPHASEMLAYLKELGIRTGVISNIGWSGKALTDRLNRLFPENEFEFIIASSEYGIRKPNRLLFDIALRRADLAPDRVWYCGDSIGADIIGAHRAGMYPVFYDNKTVEHPFGDINVGLKADFDHLHIQNWRGLTDALTRISLIAD